MSNHDDDFRTPEERRADEDDERQVLELTQLDRQLDDQQAALERLEYEDPVGMAWFGDRDEWVDSRLSRKPPK